MKEQIKIIIGRCNIKKLAETFKLWFANLGSERIDEVFNNEILIYEDKDGITKVNVTFTDEDIWLTQNQLAEIYKTTKQNISQHISSIYADKELPEISTVKKFLTVQNEGSRSVKRNIDHYNLDMIIALGYRVQSEKV